MYSSYDKLPIQILPRVFWSLIFIGLCFLLIAARLWYLQAILGEYYAGQSQNNRQRTVYVPPPRGVIQDRNGDVLAKNRPAFNIELFLNETPNSTETIEALSKAIDVPVDELQERFKRQSGARFRPRVLVRDATPEVVAKVAARMAYLPGISIRHYPIRSYVYGDFASHVIGHIREISRNELQSTNYSEYYRSGDLIGKYGLELKWERYLQGRRGVKNFVVNAHGVKIHELPDQKESIPGNVLELTIDKDIQLAADNALKEHWGAVVALNPMSGEVLALSSAPNFDPNIFTGEVSSEQWKELVSGDEHRLNNRAVQGDFPPGSTFKAIVALAGLAEGIISPQTTEFCPGYHTFGNRTFRCHKRSGHGRVNLERALAQSCDVYFYVLGERLGIDRIYDYASQFGLDSRTGLDLIHESSGLVPSTKWKKKRFAGTEQERWYPGETLSVVIGQGATLATPLQMAVAFSGIVNGGEIYRPYLVRRVYSGDGQQVIEESQPELLKTIDIEPEHLAEVREGLVSVVNAPYGTARRARLPKEWGILSGGKTGTSQVVALDRKGDDKKFEHHAWFVGYAPIDNPEIVVSALIEHGGGGGRVAAPVVGKVLESYFMKTRGLKKVEPVQQVSPPSAPRSTESASPSAEESTHQSTNSTEQP